MAVSIDASSPGVNDTGDFGTTGTATVVVSAFTSPANSLIVAAIASDSNPADTWTFTFSDSGSLSWTSIAATSPEYVSGGAAAIGWAWATASTSRTVSVTRNGTTGNTTNPITLKVYVLTGVDAATPVATTGANNEGASSSNILTTSAITSASAGGLLVVSSVDWNANGTPTSSDLSPIYTRHVAGQSSDLIGTKAIPTAGVTIGATVDGAGAGAAAWKWAQIEVRAGASGPTIDTQPVDARVNFSVTALFSVSATTSGGSLSYQWQRNPGSGFTAITGATTSTYAVAGAYTLNESVYQVVVTDSNGSVTSNTVALTVDFDTVSSAKVRVSDSLASGPIGSGGVFGFVLGAIASGSAGPITGTATITEAADTLTGAGTVSVTGNGTPTEGADTSTAAGTVSNAGAANVTEGADTLSAAGAVAVTGTATLTEGADTGASTGAVAVAGAAGITEGADTTSGTGGVAVGGSGTPTEGADTGSAAGTVAVVGNASITEGADTLTAEGTVSGGGPAPITGDANITEGADTLTAAGAVSVTGDVTATEGADTSTAAGAVAVGGGGSPSEGADNVGSTGAVAVTGDASITEGADTLTAAGILTTGAIGDADITEDADTVSGAGTVSITGDADITEGADTLTGGDEAPVVDTPVQTPAGGSSKRRRPARLFQVEYDDEVYSFASRDEAEAFIHDIKPLAQAADAPKVPRRAQRVVRVGSAVKAAEKPAQAAAEPVVAEAVAEQQLDETALKIRALIERFVREAQELEDDEDALEALLLL